MAAVHDDISPDLAAWIAEQPMFFVATAPSAGGHVNLSPKGLDTLRVLGPARVAYLDLTGSGVETIAHLRENGRITLMWCAFAGAPRIARVYGHGHRAPGRHARVRRAAPRTSPTCPERRSVIDVDVDRVSTSCGYAVPLMHYEGERDRLVDWAEAKGDDGLAGVPGGEERDEHRRAARAGRV